MRYVEIICFCLDQKNYNSETRPIYATDLDITIQIISTEFVKEASKAI